MFTGIVEEIGTVLEFSKNNKNALIVVKCEKILEDIKIGDSISINGVCQTVTDFNEKSFTTQISYETLNVTNFSTLSKGQYVNLERALTLSSRIGGHLVSGHIDGLAQVKNIQKSSDFYNIKFEVKKDFSKYVAKKGSVTLNGISLTVATIESNEFSVAVIPHTFENTTFKELKIGDFVNLEVDILAKYVEKFLSSSNNRTLDENFLKENGFF